MKNKAKTYLWVFVGIVLISGPGLIEADSLLAEGLSPEAVQASEKPEALVEDRTLLSDDTVATRIDPLSTRRLLRTLFSLIAVCALAVLLFGRFGRRFRSFALGRGVLSDGADFEAKLRVVDRLALDRENQLFVVEAVKVRLLFSTGPKGVSYHGSLDSEGTLSTANEKKVADSGAAEKVTGSSDISDAISLVSRKV